MEKLLIIIFLFLNTLFINSQQLYDLRKVSPDDFPTNDVRSIFLYSNTLLNFEYKGQDKDRGARDKLFYAEIKDTKRIFLSKYDSASKFFITHRDNITKLELVSLTIYFMEKNNLKSKKLKLSNENLIVDFKDGYFINLSDFKMKNKNLIIECVSKYSVISKKEISFHIDRNTGYQNYFICIEIPEIYTYRIICDTACLEGKLQRTKAGPSIGYLPPPGARIGGTRFISKKTFNELNKDIILPDGKIDIVPKHTPIPYKCMVNPYIFKSKDYIPSITDELTPGPNIVPLLSLILTRIDEIIN